MTDIRPARPVHPGRILRREMVARNWWDTLLWQMGGPRPLVLGKLLLGEIAITEEIAAQLARAFGTSPGLWLDLQKNYDEAAKETT